MSAAKKAKVRPKKGSPMIWQARFASQPSNVGASSASAPRNTDGVARAIDVLEFAAARAKEMKAMETAIHSHSGVRRVVDYSNCHFVCSHF